MMMQMAMLVQAMMQVMGDVGVYDTIWNLHDALIINDLV